MPQPGRTYPLAFRLFTFLIAVLAVVAAARVNTIHVTTTCRATAAASERIGATIQRALGSPYMRAFTVGCDQVDLSGSSGSAWGNLTLENLSIQGFTVKGGDSATGGGGGLGAGGAIHVDGSGSSSVGLTVVNSTYSGNEATGGNGGVSRVPSNSLGLVRE